MKIEQEQYINRYDKKQACINCLHFQEYYVKRGTQFVSLRNGHCKKHIKVKSPCMYICELWESQKADEQEIVEDVKEYIYKMKIKLDEIAYYLENIYK